MKSFLIVMAIVGCTRGDMCCNYWSLPSQGQQAVEK